MGSNSLPQPHSHSLSRNRALLFQLLSVFHYSLDNVRQANCRRWSDIDLRRIPPDVQVWTLRYDVSDEGNVSLFLLFFSFLLFFPPNAPLRHLEKIYSLIVFHYSMLLFSLCSFLPMTTRNKHARFSRTILDWPDLSFRSYFDLFWWFYEIRVPVPRRFFGIIDWIIYVSFWFRRKEIKETIMSLCILLIWFLLLERKHENGVEIKILIWFWKHAW